MFVDIKNPKSPLKVTNILTAYDKGVVVKGVRQSPQKLTPIESYQYFDGV